MRANALKLLIDCFNHEFMQALRDVICPTIETEACRRNALGTWRSSTGLGNVGPPFSGVCAAPIQLQAGNSKAGSNSSSN
jgi:hypothetical protein